MDGPRMKAGGIAAACGAALLCIVALAAALLTSVATATRYLEQAAWSQRQSAAVFAIEATAAGAVLRPPADRGAALAVLRGQLHAYRLSIVHEGQVVDQDDEARRGAALVALVDRATAAATAPDALAALDRLGAAVAGIGAAERAEGVVVERAMAALRRRMLWLGIGLAVAAVALGGLAWGALAGNNRRLARLVAVRTQEAETRSARLAEIDRTRRLFFAKLSHELRTPVTVLRGEAEVALRVDDDVGALKGALGHVVASAGFLERRLAELLGIASAEDGRLALEAAPFDLARLVHQAVTTAGPFAESSLVRLEATAPDAGVPVIGDARWILQAQLALLDNAVKFSGENSLVEVRLEVIGQIAVLEVADRGIGIADADPARMFEAYHQSDAGRAHGGVGLGLALAAWIVEQHGGRIAARPRDGGGCVIRIELPVARP